MPILTLNSGHKINVTLETVTPALAQKWLSQNSKNRKPRPRQVEILRREMAGGAWQFTHQGIAFGEQEGDGPEPLLDGQHRLLAIVAAGVAIDNVLIFRNLPRKAQEATDMGQARSVAENLQIFDGEKCTAQLTAFTNGIARHFALYDFKVSLPQTREILKLFPKVRLLSQHTAAQGVAKRPVPFRQVPVLVVCGIALHRWKDEAALFHDAYQKGTRLDEGHPAWHLRNYCVAVNDGKAVNDRQKMWNYAADCLEHFIEKRPMTSPKPTGTGPAWLRRELGPRYQSLRAILRIV